MTRTPMEESCGGLILPPDPYWPLRVEVKAGQATPYEVQLLYAYQFGIPKQIDVPIDDTQADGTP